MKIMIQQESERFEKDMKLMHQEVAELTTELSQAQERVESRDFCFDKEYGDMEEDEEDLEDFLERLESEPTTSPSRSASEHSLSSAKGGRPSQWPDDRPNDGCLLGTPIESTSGFDMDCAASGSLCFYFPGHSSCQHGSDHNRPAWKQDDWCDSIKSIEGNATIWQAKDQGWPLHASQCHGTCGKGGWGDRRSGSVFSLRQCQGKILRRGLWSANFSSFSSDQPSLEEYYMNEWNFTEGDSSQMHGAFWMVRRSCHFFVQHFDGLDCFAPMVALLLFPLVIILGSVFFLGLLFLMKKLCHVPFCRKSMIKISHVRCTQRKRIHYANHKPCFLMCFLILSTHGIPAAEAGLANNASSGTVATSDDLALYEIVPFLDTWQSRSFLGALQHLRVST